MISIVIVNWNTGELLADCLRSIRNLPDSELEDVGRVVVVDNDSKDSSFEMAQRELADDERFVYMKLRKNVGFAAANNLGAGKLQDGGHGDDDILLLNPDTVVRPGALQAMAAVLERHPKAGVVGPKLLEGDGSRVQPSVRRLPTLAVFVMFFLKVQRVWDESPVWRRYMATDFDYHFEQKCEQVMGAAFLVRNSVWRELKGLDEDFWIWFEEVDFCARAQRQGYEVWYTPGGAIVHYGGVSFGQVDGLRKGWQWVRSSLMYAGKHLGIVAWVILMLLAPVAWLLAGLAWLWHRLRK